MNLNKETLALTETNLLEKGYRKLKGHFKTEDYAWWKSFEVTQDGNGIEKTGYQIAFLVYDFSKYEKFEGKLPIGVQCEFLLGNNNIIDRVDLSVSDNEITIEKFEELSAKFYEIICVGFIFEKFIKK